MKKLIYIAVLGFSLMACNDEFLDKYPQTSATEENAFQTSDNFKAFAYPLYKMFNDKTIAQSFNDCGTNSIYEGDVNAGYMVKKLNMNKYAFQNITETASGNGWSFEHIRRANILLSHIDGSQMSDSEKEHWQAIAYFFHSYWYMELINRFGDVPWVNKVLTEASEEAYGPRADRMVVADSVLTRLKWAEEHITDQSKNGTLISRNAIRAAISRFTLREATWRKYHALGDYEKYLTECARVSELLMTDYPTLYTGSGQEKYPGAGWSEMWTTEDLSSVPGVIFFKQYLNGYVMSNFSHKEHTADSNNSLHQYMINMYLCKDGLSIHKSPNYHGDKDQYSTFRDRDPRLWQTVMPPYTVQPGGTNKPESNPNATWGYTDNPAEREYIDLIGENASCSNPGVGMKRLPAQNWGASLLTHNPNTLGGKYQAAGFIVTHTGYIVWKNYSNWEENGTSAKNTADKPIFKIEEVLLNYAECKWEQGQFTQAIADKTINLLRDRAEVGRMNVSAIDGGFDPDKPAGIDPVLWEIRRERIIELMGEGFGFDDVRRWKLAPFFINKQPVGWYTTADKVSGRGFWDSKTHLAITDGSVTEGYSYVEADPVQQGKGWLEKYYLYQVPTNEIVINPNLAPNNPGWE